MKETPEHPGARADLVRGSITRKERVRQFRRGPAQRPRRRQRRRRPVPCRRLPSRRRSGPPHTNSGRADDGGRPDAARRAALGGRGGRAHRPTATPRSGRAPVGWRRWRRTGGLARRSLLPGGHLAEHPQLVGAGDRVGAAATDMGPQQSGSRVLRPPWRRPPRRLAGDRPARPRHLRPRWYRRRHAAREARERADDRDVCTLDAHVRVSAAGSWLNDRHDNAMPGLRALDREVSVPATTVPSKRPRQPARRRDGNRWQG